MVKLDNQFKLSFFYPLISSVSRFENTLISNKIEKKIPTKVFRP